MEKELKNFDVIQKGYEIDLSVIDGGYEYSEITCSAENKNKAKSKLLKAIETKYYGMKLLYSDDEIGYLNIPVKRCEQSDLVYYDGTEMTVYDANYQEIKKKHNKDLDEISENAEITHCYIKKRGSYYGDNHCGYTDYRIKAGIYTKEDAVSSARNTTELSIVPIDIEEHNNYISKHIKDLNNRLINSTK